MHTKNYYCQFRDKYRPQTKLREGNVFTPVCHSVDKGGLPSHNAMSRQTPALGRQPSLGRLTPRSGGKPLRHTVNRRAVRILLECILV